MRLETAARQMCFSTLGCASPRRVRVKSELSECIVIQLQVYYLQPICQYTILFTARIGLRLKLTVDWMTFLLELEAWMY